MRLSCRPKAVSQALFSLCTLMLLLGCQNASWDLLPTNRPLPNNGRVPADPSTAVEKRMRILPEYRIEPPDLLEITAINLVPKAPYRLRTRDTIFLQVVGTVPDAPIDGEFPIGVGGVVNLGFSYGSVKISGLTVEESQEAIRRHLLKYLKFPVVNVGLGNIASSQQVEGPHEVGPDGRVNLGTYGTVVVTGMTVPEATDAVEKKLSEQLEDPEVSLIVADHPSKNYYIITQGAGLGDTVLRRPITGNETVLDAISDVEGLSQNVSQKNIWVARPGCTSDGCDQLLRVDWRAISQLGDVSTNYQLMPGDRLYLSENKWIRFDNDLAIWMAPFTRLFNFTQQGVRTVSRLSGNVLGGGSDPNANIQGGASVPIVP